MSLSNLLNSTTVVLLLGGLAVLFLNVIFSALRLSRGHVRAGIFSVVLVLGACILIGTGLVRMTFPALAGTSDSTALAAAPAADSAPGVMASPTLAAPQQIAVASGPLPALSNASSGGGGGGQSVQAGLPGGQSGQTGATAGTSADSTAAIPSSRLAAVTVLGSVVIVLAGLILYSGERRRQGFDPSSSAGLLYTGAGVLVLVATLVVPGLSSGVTDASGTGTAGMTSSNSVRAIVGTSTPTGTPVPSSTPTALPTLTPVASSSPTPLFTAIAYVAGADASSVTTCSVTAQTMLNLRGDPSTQQPAIGKIFAGSLLSVTGRSADKKWWRVISKDGGTAVEGWVSADYVKTTSGCVDSTIPVVGATLTPSSTPRPSTTATP